MEKVITFTMSFFLFLGMTFAQEIKPKFEKQDNLTKATYYYDNGTVKETGYLKNDKLHDKWISFNKEGKITTIANYKNGIKEGKWYVVENDTVKELTYKSNKLIKVENLKGSYIPLN